MPITTVFLDAGGVLVTPNWHRVAAALERQGVAVDPGALAAADPLARHELDLGLAPKASDQNRGFLYFNRLLERSGVTLSDKTEAALEELGEYHNRVNLWETVPDGVPAALERMREMGLRLAVVSNANGKLKVLFDRMGLTRHFDVMLDSTDEGVEKPDRRLFDIAVERMGVRRDEVVHVGDLFSVDVEGARNAGLHAVLLDPLDLYATFDCERVRSLGELVERLAGRVHAGLRGNREESEPRGNG